MEKKSLKHLVVALGGFALLSPGMSLFLWVMSNLELRRIHEYGFAHEIGQTGLWPLLIMASAMLIVGLACIIGAMVCESGRYDKK